MVLGARDGADGRVASLTARLARTLTTVGYGDSVLHTVGGQIVGIILMFVGLGFIAVLTASIAAFFVKVDEAADTERPILDALARIEAELAEVKARLDAQEGRAGA